ncbi:MAG: hypothetical protein AB7E68_02630 [Candidatus Babeliales bacterium]
MIEINIKKIVKTLFIYIPLSTSFLLHADEKKITIVTNLTYEQFQDFFKQDYSNFRVVCIGQPDDSLHENINYISLNERLGLLGTFWQFAHSCADDEILIPLLSSEIPAHDQVLRTINAFYQDDQVWMTGDAYYSDTELLHCRKNLLSIEQPSTFYAWLFKVIKLQDLTCNNYFFESVYKQAMFYPMIEMAQRHIALLDEKLFLASLIHKNANEADEELIGLEQKEPYKALNQPILTLRKREKADLIIFSFNRPLQLYALLESVERYIDGIASIQIIYRPGNKDMRKAYKKVKKRFSSVIFIKQSSTNPQVDFKRKTLEALSKGSSNYIVFAVDDIIVKDYVDIADCANYLKMTHAHGFYLRLGKNITYCYMNKCNQDVPDLIPVSNDVGAWQFKGSGPDWGCPNTVDMTVYSRKEIVPILQKLDFDNPNYLEGAWCAHCDINKLGLCFHQSKIINIPLNQVQNCSGCNLSMNISWQELFKQFKNGYKLDISKLYKIQNNSPHMEYQPTFIKR